MTEVVSGNSQKTLTSFSIRKMFVIAVTTGSASILIGAMFSNIFFSLVLPLVVMGGYAYLAYNNSLDLPRTVVGDSFYYLGFILTLTAVAASLWVLSSTAVEIGKVVQSFGAALGTTILGLVFRLMFTSFSAESSVRRERLEHELERSISTFTGQIEVMTNEVIKSLITTQSQCNNALQSTTSDYEKQRLDMFSSFNDIESKVSEFINGLEDKFNKIEIKPDIISGPINKSMKTFIDTVEEHSASYQEASNSILKQSEQLAKKFSENESLQLKHNKLLGDKLDEVITQQSEQYRSNLETISASIINSLGDIKDVKIDVNERVSKEFMQLESVLKRSVSGFEVAITSFDGISVKAKEIEGSFSSSAEKMSESLVFAESIVGAMGAFNDSNSAVASSLGKLVSTINGLEEQLTENRLDANKANELVKESAKATHNASTQMANDISNVYGHLALQIKSLREAS